MSKLLLIDGNSILNRAFYGIMGSKMLTSKDGKHTNAVYGFLAILFKELEEVNPDHIMVAFDVKAPTERHKKFAEYKANRHGMPDELAEQMPMIKDVLRAMNISIVEMAGYEGDDILGTMSVIGEKAGFEVVILSGDRDNFQLATNKVTIRIPRTKAGKTETDNYDKKKIVEEYGLNPSQLKDVKGLQGDTSDNIPGVPGIGEKTALGIIQKYGSIEELYAKIDAGEDDLKGKQKENIINNRELAFLSKDLGTINVNAPIEVNIDDLKIVDWNFEETLRIFRDLNFNRYIERFNLEGNVSNEVVVENKIDISNLFENEILDNFDSIIDKIKSTNELYFNFECSENDDANLIIKKKIKYVNIYIKEDNKVYSIKYNPNSVKEVFENEDIKKIGFKLKDIYIILKQDDITIKNLYFDLEIAEYIIDVAKGKYNLDEIAYKYLDIDTSNIEIKEVKEEQTSLFDMESEADNSSKEKPEFKYLLDAYVIGNAKEKLEEKLVEIESLELFNNIDMPLDEILASMQWEGMYIDKEELVKYGDELKENLEVLRKDIYELAGEEFNINSPKQLGVILFEKLGLTCAKKTKSGYSTDVDTLEKIKDEHPIIEKILEYRQIMKLNSTYVEGMIPFINKKTDRVHTFFHQTVTSTGRLSSSEPNLQNIPTRSELGKQLRKVFKPADGKVFVDADYSQVELRVLSHMSNDETMIEAFNSGMDIHTMSASQVFKVPVEEVSKELRSKAKAVNFGIVYGISDFGLAGQIDIKRSEAKQYIEQYLETYHGIKDYMDEVINIAKRKGYAITLFGRRRYIEELNNKNFMIRKFGERAAMNTPIQGTAADIMKIAMIKVYNELKNRNLQSKIVLQIHDELIIETLESEKEEVKKLLKESMESAASLKVPLTVEVEEGTSWYQAK